MALTMRILGWKAEGLRCPDHVIDCCEVEDTPAPVTLIQMPNGTGKTTTLDLLRAAFSGTASGVEWGPERVLEFRKRDAPSTSGLFELKLQLNGKRVTIAMNFDFNAGRVIYKTTRGRGQLDGFDPPTEFRRYMNENFVNFFVFNGELADHMLDKRYSDAEAVVDTLFQINTLRSISELVEGYWDEYVQRVKAKEEKGLSRRKNRLNDLKDRLSALEKQRAKLASQRKEIEKDLTKWRSAYASEIKKGSARAETLQTAEKKVQDLGREVDTLAHDLLDSFREPHALSSVFAEKMYELKTGLDRVKLPESAAREFFEELAQENECVCGRPIDDEIRAKIRARAKLYLGSDDVSLLNAMKTAVEEAVGKSRTEPEERLRKEVEKLTTANDDLRDASNVLDALKTEVEHSDPKLQEASEVIRRNEAELERIAEELEQFESKDDSLGDDQTYGIAIIKRRVADAERMVAEATKTMELKAKRDVLTKILATARDAASREIGNEICAEANAKIEKLLPYNKLRIDRIERSVVLQRQAGGSVGETLSIGYAFLSTLFDRAEHQLPFVVDSPAGPIDLAVRPRIGELVPKLSKQFIAFTISSERDKFLEGLRRASKGVQYVTLFRKGSKELEAQARATNKCVVSDDGILVRGEKFFGDFQVDQET